MLHTETIKFSSSSSSLFPGLWSCQSSRGEDWKTRVSLPSHHNLYLVGLQILQLSSPYNISLCSFSSLCNAGTTVQVFMAFQMDFYEPFCLVSLALLLSVLKSLLHSVASFGQKNHYIVTIFSYWKSLTVSSP